MLVNRSFKIGAQQQQRRRSSLAKGRGAAAVVIRRAAGGDGSGAPTTTASGGAGGGAGAGAGGGLSEDVIARLRAAEEEAAQLKRKLVELQAQAPAQSPQSPQQPAVLDARPKRIDGTGNRETLFPLPSPGGSRGGADGASGSGGSSGSSGISRGAWLSEADVDFITGGGPSEAAALSGPTAEEQATIRRRTAIGAVATLALGGFALVPTKDLRGRPPKPLYFYLAALVRAQAQLAPLKGYVDNADWGAVRLVVPRIVGPPGDVKDALFSAIALLDDRARAARAEDVAGDLLDALASIDSPRKYFDAMPQRAVTGGQQAEFVRFASGALGRAEAKLSEFLALMPRDAVDAARAAVAAEAAAGEDE